MRYIPNMLTSGYSRDMPTSRYVSTNLLPSVYADLRRLTANLTVDLDRRVTISEVVAGLIELAGVHRDELISKIRTPAPTTSGANDD